MTAQSLNRSAVATLSEWKAPSPEQDSLRHTYLAFLDATPEGCLRRSVPGHLTGSAIVFDATGDHVLLTLHPRVGRWIQLGGHCEPEDQTLVDAALREAHEESGIEDLSLCGLAQLHTHPITCSLGVPTRHLDVRFVVVAPVSPSGSLPPIHISSESTDLRWWPVTALPADTEGTDIVDLVQLGRRQLPR